MVLSLIVVSVVAVAALTVAARQRTVIAAQRRLLSATQSLTATMTPTQVTHDLAATLNGGDDVMVSVGIRGVTVGLVSDKNTSYAPAQVPGSVEAHSDATIEALFA